MFSSIRNEVLTAGGSIVIGVPTPIIIGALRIFAGQTGCDNIVSWNQVNRNDLTDFTKSTAEFMNGVRIGNGV